MIGRSRLENERTGVPSRTSKPCGVLSSKPYGRMLNSHRNSCRQFQVGTLFMSLVIGSNSTPQLEVPPASPYFPTQRPFIGCYEEEKRVDQNINGTNGQRQHVATKLVAERCWPLQDIDMVDLASGQQGSQSVNGASHDRDISNAINVRAGRNPSHIATIDQIVQRRLICLSHSEGPLKSCASCYRLMQTVTPARLKTRSTTLLHGIQHCRRRLSCLKPSTRPKIDLRF
jgi:hypothetical protein